MGITVNTQGMCESIVQCLIDCGYLCNCCCGVVPPTPSGFCTSAPPHSLSASITTSDTCTCMSGTEFTYSWNETKWRWEGQFSACGYSWWPVIWPKPDSIPEGGHPDPSYFWGESQHSNYCLAEIVFCDADDNNVSNSGTGQLNLDDPIPNPLSATFQHSFSGCITGDDPCESSSDMIITVDEIIPFAPTLQSVLYVKEKGVIGIDQQMLMGYINANPSFLRSQAQKNHRDIQS
jgi:hypothetical protein